MKEERSLPQMQCDSALPSELSPLVELMAENVHDVWMRTRTEQGWTYGPERNDAEKKHPCLVPYDQLPEEEKVYDRNTSIETLRFIIDHGFDIRLNPLTNTNENIIKLTSICVVYVIKLVSSPVVKSDICVFTIILAPNHPIKRIDT